jgi:hypothetical protein
MALALAELARRQLENGDLGSRHDVKPHVRLVVDVDGLAQGLPGELQVPGQGAPTLLPAESVRRILCDADITAVVTARARTGEPAGPATVPAPTAAVPAARRSVGAGVTAPRLDEWLRAEARTVLYVGRSRRTAPLPLRVALEIRDGHCAFPDCTVDTSRCEAHHVTYWRHHGQTALDNMCLLCARHHHLVHEGGWQITATGADPGQNGCWTFTPPPRTRP